MWEYDGIMISMSRYKPVSWFQFSWLYLILIEYKCCEHPAKIPTERKSSYGYRTKTIYFPLECLAFIKCQQIQNQALLICGVHGK